jgi:cbb3-type cytochrome oxidase maturation protein
MMEHAMASSLSDGATMDFFYLIPIALALGMAGLGAFMWSLKSGQYDDLDGAAERLLFDDTDHPASEQ